MRTLLFLASSLALLLGVTPVLAQQQAPAQRTAVPSGGGAPAGGSASPGGQGIAVIDITFILDHYEKLKRDTEGFKRDMEGAETKLKAERDTMAKKAERLKALKPGTPEFKNQEEEILKLESDWKLRIARQKSEFAEREAKTYLGAYQEITKLVKAHADKNGIALVLRFNGAPVDPNNREAVQADVLKMVMYYNPTIDITDPILEQLNGRAAVAQPPRAPATRR